MVSSSRLLSSVLFALQLLSCRIAALDISSLLAAQSILATGAANSTTGYLDVNGASLYYETYGTGPLLLFISGANGDADIWRPIAKILASNYTVAIYDRRGFSRSYLSPAAIQNYTLRLETDATDAKLLLDHLSPSKPVTVLGTSSGAIVALQLLQMYPQRLKTLIPHEPPMLTILPDAANLATKQKEVYTIYRAAGIPAALYFFSLYYDGKAPDLSSSIPGFSVDPRETPYNSGNWQYWFERELLQYPLETFNLTAIGQWKDKLLLANGNETRTDDPQYRSNEVMAKALGLNVTLLAGQHTGYAGDTRKQFAADLLAALGKRV